MGQLTLVRSLIWQRTDQPGMEHCALYRLEDGWEVEGKVIVVLDGAPTFVRYAVRCSPRWATVRTDVSVRSGPDARHLVLEVDEHHRWWTEERELSELQGAVDVDLGATPSTNTLPIRRLGLAVGEAADIVAAWVRFPDLEVLPSRQRYTRLGERRYRYESGTFSADLDVDDLGLVAEYEGLFTRLAARDGGRSAP